MKKVLITSIGSLVGQNILDALEGRRDKIQVIGTNSLSNVSGNFRCDRCYLVEYASHVQQFTSDLLRVIEKEQPDVVVPGRDDDIVILTALRESHDELQDRILCGSSAFARVMYNKVRSYEFSANYSLPFSPTVESNLSDTAEKTQKLIEIYGYPLIAKPATGNGSRGIRIITDGNQLDKINQLPGYAIQPLFGHSEEIKLDVTHGLPFFWEIEENALYGVQILIDKQGGIHSYCGFVSKMVGGKCEQIKVYEDNVLINIALEFAKSAIEEGWRGPLNIQFKKDERFGFQAIEMNGRFSGGTSARYFFGFDEVAILLNEWIGQIVIAQVPLHQEVDVVIKSLSDFPVNRSFEQALYKDKIWEI